jgi:hypothetical protein
LSRERPGETVNLDKLGKQLRRDMAANPKKAAMLALMMLVALYFWGPLAWRWLSAQGSKRSSKVNLASLILTDDPAEPSHQNKARGGAKFKWERARELIRQDARMRSASFDVSWHDPFGKPAGGAAIDTSAATTKAAAEAMALQAENAGLVLESVIVGPRTRVATINGESCREGDRISVPNKQDPETRLEFRVVRIYRHAVELEVGEQRVMLALVPPTLAQGDELQRNKGKRIEP